MLRCGGAGFSTTCFSPAGIFRQQLKKLEVHRREFVLDLSHEPQLERQLTTRQMGFRTLSVGTP